MKTTFIFGWVTAITLIFAGDVFSQERYRVVRNSNGEVERILDVSLGKMDDVKDFSFEVRSDLAALTTDSKLFQKSELAETFDVGKTAKLERKLEKYQHKIAKYEIEKYFNDKRMDQILEHFQAEILKIRGEKYQTLSHLKDRFFFTKEELFVRAVRGAKTLAKSLTNDRIFLNLVFYIIDQYISNLMEAKSYHQHILLAYLQVHGSEVFELSADELKRSMSSIMESRLDVWNVFSLLKIKGEFASFYKHAIEKVRKRARKRMRKHACRYQGRADYVNDFHAWWTDKESGARQILNLYQTRSYFSSRPSIAYDENSPNKAFKQRRLYKLVNFAQNLIPVPFVGALLKNYNEKRYERQIREEGLLYGQFEIEDDVSMMDIFKKQTLNPLIRL